MQSTKIASRRRLAAGVATVLVAGAASALTGAPAQAAPATGELTWNISQQFVEHLYFSKAGPTLPTTPTGSASAGAAHHAGDPAVSTDDVFTFPASATTKAADGTVTTSYTGTVRGAFVNGGTEYYSVTVSDPVVVVSPTGQGEIRATVTGTDPSSTTPASQVTVADFTGASAVGASTSATPAWEGVLAAGSQQALDLGITTTTRPVDGKSFHPDFLGAVPSGVRAHFYYSTSGDHKRPGSFTAAATPTPTITSSVIAADPVNGLSIRAQGAGFSAVTNPGDAGVYVALAPADTVIDYGNRASMAAMTAVAYVMPSDFVGDTFSTVLNAPVEKLVPGTAYALFTWQAHTHSNSTQDTKTPVVIDWTQLQVATPVTPPTAPVPSVPPVAPGAKVDAKVRTSLQKPTARKAGKLVVRIKGADATATGKVIAKLKTPGQKAKQLKAKLNAKGKAVVRLPKSKRGQYQVVVQYRGDATFNKARKVVTYRVR
ncbi:HtaA domain-containing protein [Nocardioides sp. 616]|uniref:HtaA domain-containing protein n=1 Tax=Nocardioides sp. 616 TaxID=2268090 RepID=UPI000CE304AB|nr:HtaA domain-containing protein [Nocardioides sp. 616]